jgi:hypothetical protein
MVITFGFNKMLGIFQADAQLAASQEGPSPNSYKVKKKNGQPTDTFRAS